MPINLSELKDAITRYYEERFEERLKEIHRPSWDSFTIEAKEEVRKEFEAQAEQNICEMSEWLYTFAMKVVVYGIGK